MQTPLEQIPRTGQIQVTIHVSARFNYSIQAAQRLVRRFVADEISYLLRADTPALVVAEELYWRVPLILAFPDIGAVGQAGTVDVNVETGQLSITPEQVAKITRQAYELAARRSTASSSPSVNSSKRRTMVKETQLWYENPLLKG